MGLIDFGKGTRSASRCRQPSGIAGTGDDQIHLPAAAPGTDKPLEPIRNPCVRTISSGHHRDRGSTWWPRALHETISRMRAAAALLSVIGGPGGDFMSLCCESALSTNNRELPSKSVRRGHCRRRLEKW
jgi:hypothetical protein